MTKLTNANIQGDLLENLAGGYPIISNVQIATSSYTVLDDTSIDVNGGYIVINGDGFESDMSLLVGETYVNTFTFVSSNVIRAQLPAKPSGSYNLTITNNDNGASAIGVNSITYSSFPAWSSNSSLDEVSADEAFEINLNANSDSNVVFSLQEGSSLPPGANLFSNGSLSGTIIIEDDTTYNFTVEATDEENQNTPRNFSLPVAAGDPYFRQTSVLLTAESTSNASFFQDASNNSIVSVNTSVNFVDSNPCSTNLSWYFDGSGDRAEVNNPINLGTDDFTVEFWINPSIQYTSSSGAFLISGEASGTGLTWGISFATYNGYDGLAFTYGVYGSYTVGRQVVGYWGVPGRWDHIAWQRRNGTIECYINGVSQTLGTYNENSTFSDSANFTTNATYKRIGSDHGGASVYTGFLSNLRIVRGNAVYDGDFTPPSAVLEDIANTVLLTCRSIVPKDFSENNYTVTWTGDVRSVTTGPYTETNNNCFSASFNGASGSNVIVEDNDGLDGFDGDFTIEFWIQYYSFPSISVILDKGWNGSAYAPYLFYTSGTSLLLYSSSTGSSWNITSGTAIATGLVAGRWYHIAVSRSGSSMRFFVNGVLGTTVTTTATFVNRTDRLFVGSSGNHANWFNGLLSNLRIVKGTAVYTSSFDPPIEPLTAISGTTLLLFNQPVAKHNSLIVNDSSKVGHGLIANGLPSSGTFGPYNPNGWSYYFDGSGDYLTIPYNTDYYNWWTDNFTIECWIYPESNTNVSYVSGVAQSVVVGNRAFNSTTNYWSFGPLADGTVSFYYYNGAAQSVTSTATVNFNQWNHVAMTHRTAAGGVIDIFVNGVASGSSSLSGTPQSSAGVPLTISAGNNLYYRGYVSNLRIVKGEALYFSGSSPYEVAGEPLKPYNSNILFGGYTTLLIGRNNITFDESPIKALITRNGDTRLDNFSPFRGTTISYNAYSNFFSVNGDHLTISANSSFAPSTNDFSVEFWFNLTAYPASNQIAPFFQNDQIGSSSSDKFWIGLFNNAGTYQLALGQHGTSNRAVVPFTPLLGKWYHVSFERSSGTILIYLNGVSQTVTNSTIFSTTNFGQNGVAIGSISTPYYLKGSISDLRYIVGSVAYTEDFSVPTSILQKNSNTVLLTCRSNSFVDDSDNNFSITTNGSTTTGCYISKNNPYGETFTSSLFTQHNFSNHGGSLEFNIRQTGDYIETYEFAKNQFFRIPGAFTIEGWYYREQQPSYPTLFEMGLYTDGILFRFGSDGLMWVNNALRQGATTLHFSYSWNHFCIVRDSNNILSLYINGRRIYSASIAGVINNAGSPLRLGSSRHTTGQLYDGKISEFHVVKGAALYDPNKTSINIPTQPITPHSQTVFLLQNNSEPGVYDYTGKHIVTMYENAKTSTVQYKQGNKSIYFDGTNDAIAIEYTSAIGLLQGDFTVEMWIYPVSLPAAFTVLSAQWRQTGGLGGYSFTMNSTGTLSLSWGAASEAASVATTSTTVSTNQWTHVALTRSGSTFNIWIDGVSSATYTSTTTKANLAYVPMTIGHYLNSSNLFPASAGQYYNGYIDEYRVTKGIARYTDTFVPPTRHKLK